MWFNTKNKSDGDADTRLKEQENNYNEIIKKLEGIISAQQEIIKAKDSALLKVNTLLLKLESKQFVADTSPLARAAKKKTETK